MAEFRPVHVEKSISENRGDGCTLKPTHFLLSRQPDHQWYRDQDGDPLVTLCNFELIRRSSA